MNLSDIITQSILQMLEQQESVEIQRNDLANRIGCVPSQINYVLTSRFKPEQGYIVQSRRGGGGFVKITRVNLNGRNKNAYIMHIVNSIGDTLDASSAQVIIQNMCSQGLIEKSIEKAMLAAVSNTALKAVEPNGRCVVRAHILKQMLLSQA